MKKLLIICTLFFSAFYVFGQEKRILKQGKVVLENDPISDVHIINKNTNVGTITNDIGFFEIPMKVGDSLYFSHLNLKDKLILITKEVILLTDFRIQLNEKTVALDGFILEKPRSIFYVDKDIMPNNGPVVNAKTLNLPYANTKVKKEDAVLKIRSGAVVSLYNLLNSLNGSSTRKKQLNKVVKEDATLLKIRNYFTDDFFITDLKIKKEYINPFLNYCIDKNIIATFNKNNVIKLTRLLMVESKDFPHKIENEDLYLTNN